MVGRVSEGRERRNLLGRGKLLRTPPLGVNARTVGPEEVGVLLILRAIVRTRWVGRSRQDAEVRTPDYGSEGGRRQKG
jgi:hypothetical protein